MRHKGIRHKTGSAHAPRGRQGIRPSRPYRWLSLGTFAELVLGAVVGTCTRGAKTMISLAQGERRVYGWGSKVAVQGPPMDPSDGLIASLVELDT